nr:uncharacterized protein LOC132771751 isoform X2 [Anolis sagrei ordinatus]
MDSSLNACRENSNLLLKDVHLESNDLFASPALTKNVRDDTTTMENAYSCFGEEPLMGHSLVQLIDWDSQISQDQDSLKHSRCRFGGSADNILSLTSGQSVLPLEWKVLRSSRSQDTLAHFSDIPQECTDGGYKPSMDNNQYTVDDIIGDDVVFSIFPQVLKHNQGNTYTADFRTASPILRFASSTPQNAKQSLNVSECIALQCPRTEKLLEVGTQVNQSQSSAIEQDSSFIDQMGDLLVQSKFQQKCPVENKWERTDMKNVQSKGQLLFKEQSLNLTDSGKQNSKAENVLNKEESTNSLLKSECNSPIILQQFIVNLKSQINHLHKANKTAVLQLAKADEEMSQLKNEMALLKTEYLQQLADCTEENFRLKKKINRMHNCHGPVDTYEQALHEEICELRTESRRIRAISHQLNEENHRLKEELWDVKRQYELLMHTLTGKQDESLEECHRNNASPSPVNSDSTDILIAGYSDPEVARENRNLKDNITEENIEMNGNNVSDLNQHKQTCHKSSMENISCSTSSRFSQMDACSKYSPHRVHMDTSILSRRPFAPRSIADLKVGNLVKFSGTAGKISKGTVKHLGPLFGREENYLGIELEGDQVGRHDGVFQGTRYFLCEPNKGVFVNFNKVIIAWE